MVMPGVSLCHGELTLRPIRMRDARELERLKADASDTAVGFFEHRGYVPLQRNTVRRNGEWLANTTVEKKFDKETP